MVFHLFKKKAQDQRDNRLVLVIECILNQNARDLGAATYPSMNFEVIGLCMKYHVGMVQIPCPEIACLGFLRKREPGKSIRDALDTEFGRECCIKLARIVGDRVKCILTMETGFSLCWEATLKVRDVRYSIKWRILIMGFLKNQVFLCRPCSGNCPKSTSIFHLSAFGITGRNGWNRISIHWN